LQVHAIFVSYRRNDSEGEAGRLYDDLVEMFGDRSVFMDVADITVGRDFRKAIDENVAKCGALLALIGPGWVDAKNDSGGRRLDDPADFVRIETASALKRDVPVVPVLVRGAKMPRTDQLPDDLKELAYRNCVEVTHARWKSDIKILVRALRTILGEPEDIVAGKAAVPRRGLATTTDWTSEKVDQKLRAFSSTSPSKTDLAAALQVPPTAQPTATPPNSPGSGTVPQTKIAGDDAGCVSLDPEMISRITKELARYIGPIAEVVVRRAARRCSTVCELRRTVAEEIDLGTDRTSFLDSCPGS
jgi:TIR domain